MTNANKTYQSGLTIDEATISINDAEGTIDNPIFWKKATKNDATFNNATKN